MKRYKVEVVLEVASDIGDAREVGRMALQNLLVDGSDSLEITLIDIDLITSNEIEDA